MTTGDAGAQIDLGAFYDALESSGRPLATARDVATTLDLTQADASDALDALAKRDELERLDASNDPVLYFPTDWSETVDRERVVVFPNRREVVVDRPTQFTRARLAGFAHLIETNRDEGYVYEIRPEDVWSAPYDDLEDLLDSVRAVLGERSRPLEDWIGSQWDRAHAFRLFTHEEGYVVLEAQSADLLGNVAESHVEEDHIRAWISDTEAWAAEEATADIKRSLYEAGYPVQDERHLETGEDLDLSVELRLRDYQRAWVDRFLDSGSGVLVGPPGSGKTVAALGIMEAVGGETLILAPSRELVSQWRGELVEKTSLTEEQVGEYHGGTKQIRPVTLATYRTAGMDRHRALFEERRWGLVVYDEVHHIGAPVYRRTADLQTRHRLGLSATPVRADDAEEEIFTLIGPPIGTDWGALFDAGYVVEPEVEIRYVPWGSTEARNAYVSARGHERRQAAASNPAKIDEIEHILREHPGAKTLIFVEYLDQGEAIAEALSVPFVSGETPHARRRRLFEGFRSGPRDVLVVSRIGDEGLDLPEAEVAIAASGLGGSRRQGAQRAGRTMRPVGRARMFVLATRGTDEEEFARRRTQHLSEKGVRVREVSPEDTVVDPPEE
ncbi:MAG: DEAD/DEAH box helicase [Halobacteriales archaeon]